EARERSRFDAASWRAFAEFRGVFAAGMAVFLTGFVVAYPLAVAGVRYILGLLAAGSITPGDLSLIFGYFFGLVAPWVALGSVWPSIQGSAVGLHRVFHFLERLPVEADASDRPSLPPVRERIAFEDVSFAYDGTPVLREVSFEAQAGTITAVVGAAGAGETTAPAPGPRRPEPPGRGARPARRPPPPRPRAAARAHDA